MNGVLVFAYLRQKIKTMIENFEKSREIMACTMKTLSCPFDSQGNGGDHRPSKMKANTLGTNKQETLNLRPTAFVKTQMSKFNDRHAPCLNEI